MLFPFLLLLLWWLWLLFPFSAIIFVVRKIQASMIINRERMDKPIITPLASLRKTGGKTIN